MESVELEHRWTQGDIHLVNNLYKTLNGISDEGQKVRTVWEDGEVAHTKKVFGVINEYDLRNGEFPVSSLRPTAWRSALKETLWIYQEKSDDVNLLEEKYGVKYWRSWANKSGNLGLAYGAQLRYEHKYKEGYFNRLSNRRLRLNDNPYSRRMLTNLYNHDDIHDMTLVPCAFLTMWDYDGEHLNVTLVQRSSDYILAGSVNTSNYILLQHMIAQIAGMKVGKFHHYINNLHTYSRHFEAGYELLDRYSDTYDNLELELPKLIIEDSIKNFYDFKPEHFTLLNYKPMSQIKLEVAL